MLTPITQTLNNLLEQLIQLSMTNTSSHSTSSHHKSHHKNTDGHTYKYHKRDTNTKPMVITTETNHTVKQLNYSLYRILCC